MGFQIYTITVNSFLMTGYVKKKTVCQKKRRRENWHECLSVYCLNSVVLKTCLPSHFMWDFIGKKKFTSITNYKIRYATPKKPNNLPYKKRSSILIFLKIVIKTLVLISYLFLLYSVLFRFHSAISYKYKYM